jgi:hypothetical protein
VIAARSLARSDFAAVTSRAAPWLARAERLLRPRLGLLASPPAERLVSIVCFLLAVILLLPIPLDNVLPALAICLLAPVCLNVTASGFSPASRPPSSPLPWSGAFSMGWSRWRFSFSPMFSTDKDGRSPGTAAETHS